MSAVSRTAVPLCCRRLYVGMASLHDGLMRFGERPHAPVTVLLALSALLLLTGLGWSGLNSWDEGAYAVVARGILRSGDVVHLRLGDEPYMNKPPLYMIVTAGIFALFGISEFTARLPAALFGCLTVVMSFVLFRRLFGGGVAWVGSLLLLSHMHVLSVARYGRMETLVAFLILLACWAAVRCREDGRHLYLSAAATALAVLTKGAMGLMAGPLVGVLLLGDKRARAALIWPRVLLAAALFLCIAVPWFALEYRAYGQRYLDVFVGEQLIRRVSTSLHNANPPPWWFYLRHMTVSYVAFWGPLIPLGMLFAARRAWHTREGRWVFLAVATWLPLLAFSLLIKTKYSWYIFLAYPAAAACVSLWLASWRPRYASARSALMALSLLTMVGSLLTLPAGRHSIPELSRAISAKVPAGEALYADYMETPALLFYLDRPVTVFDPLDKAAIVPPPRAHVVLATKRLNAFAWQRTVEVLARSPEHLLVRMADE